MAKQKISYDPDFKTKGKKSIVHARTTQCQFKRNMPKYNKKTWKIQERRIYLNFIKENKELLQKCRKNQTFVIMSKIIKSRDHDQCKAHHVKMMKKNAGSIESLVKSQQQKLLMHQNQEQDKKIQQKLINRKISDIGYLQTGNFAQSIKLQQIEQRLIIPTIQCQTNQIPVFVLNFPKKTFFEREFFKKQ